MPCCQSGFYEPRFQPAFKLKAGDRKTRRFEEVAELRTSEIERSRGGRGNPCSPKAASSSLAGQPEPLPQSFGERFHGRKGFSDCRDAVGVHKAARCRGEHAARKQETEIDSFLFQSLPTTQESCLKRL